MRARIVVAVLASVAVASACSAQQPSPSVAPTPSTSNPPSVSGATPTPSPSTPAPEATTPPPTSHTFTVVEHEAFEEPWAMTALPGTDLLAITEKGGGLKLRGPDGVREVSRAPSVTVTNQGGFGDLIVGPTFAEDGTVYLSWVEGSGGTSGAVVATAKLDATAATLTGVTKLWEQTPKLAGGSHYSQRLAIRDGFLYVTSGDRQQFTPAQEFDSNLGKVLRLTLAGQPAPDNPFVDRGQVARQFWSIGHRNPLGLAFDAEGRLWSTEMGPKGGDELNLILPGRNYGWPDASNGSNYDGSDIPDHKPGDGFEAPKVWWNPSISPGSLLIYQGDTFPAWRGDAFIGALSGEALIRVRLDGESATLADTWPMGSRIRAVTQGPDGGIWLLQDGAGGKLLELRPA